MPENILVIDDDDDFREILARTLIQDGYSVVTASNGEEALEKIEAEEFDLILSDLMMPGINGIELLEKIKGGNPSAIVVILTGLGSVENAVTAMQKGAFDFIIKPTDFDNFLLKINRFFKEKRLLASNKALKAELNKSCRVCTMIGVGDALKSVCNLIEKVAPTDSNVLVTGESGTGKELVARAIHSKSLRAKELFLPINCAAIPSELMESQIFGHLKGAFTGASENHEGLFYTADRGTIFLDEIGSMPLELQSKLLRVIETREVLPVGGSKHKKVDIRIIAAHNRDLNDEIANGRFREDLYYRLKVFEIHLPPLRERKEDLPMLAEHFLRKSNSKFHKEIKGIESGVINRFLQYEWKGNIRELENIIERAVIMCDGEFLTELDLPLELSLTSSGMEGNYNLKEMMSLFEKEHIKSTLDKTGNDKKAAAKLLGLGLSSLYRKIEEYEIEPGKTGNLAKKD